ncbi:hypothetical protein KEM55_000540 [Ascosphaera atra]|nr:hypothetical protein KEM55_000540 [Ascosphaera atra]
MFPQANRREVMWDLARNGGNVAATTERILTGGRLDTPPRNFQPDIPPAPEAPTVRAPDATPPKPAAESLIARYNLVDRVKEESLSPSPEEGASADNSRSPSPATKSAWSQNKAERQRLLQKRRDDMILAARRRMVEKEKTKGSGSA